MEYPICGHYTNNFTICQRRVACAGQACHHHMTDEERERKEFKGSPKKSSPQKKTSRLGSETLSMQMLHAVAYLSPRTENGLVSKQAIAKYVTTVYHREVKPKIMNYLLSRMVEKEYLTRVKLSYKLGPNADELI